MQAIVGGPIVDFVLPFGRRVNSNADCECIPICTATADKRAAKRAVSELAISKQVEADAMRSISAMDRIGTEDEPRFKPQPLPKRDERFNQVVDLSHQEDSNARLAQNPVTALNLAVSCFVLLQVFGFRLI